MMKKTRIHFLILFACLGAIFFVSSVVFGASPGDGGVSFPRSLSSYNDTDIKSIFLILLNRINLEPFNLVATIIFLCAIVHTFLTNKFIAVAHKWEREFQKKIDRKEVSRYSIHHGAKLFHFFGDVEIVFGLWVIVLSGAIIYFHGRETWLHYISHEVNFSEALFVVTIMILAASRPILLLAGSVMRRLADLMGGSLAAWWLIILTIGPILGSLITEPAAMTICALLLAEKLYDLGPTEKFKYATLGLLFVNVSVGGTLSNFAAPPILMVAKSWDWGMIHMLSYFGWKAVLGITLSNGLYFFLFRGELRKLEAEHRLRSLKDHIQRTFMSRMNMTLEFEKIGPLVTAEMGITENVELKIEKAMAEIKNRLETRYLPEIIERGSDPQLVKEAFDQRFAELKLLKIQELVPGILPPEKRAPFIDPTWDKRDDKVPFWVTGIHVLFMAWIIWNAHYPQLFIPGLLFFLGFTVVSSQYQNRINLLSPMLVGFFLGALVIHGGVQGWWIAPVLGNLKEVSLMCITTILTAFNDNAAITYLSTLVPGFTDELKYAVVAGAVTGGGLTVIANAPNPAGQSILKKFFTHGVSAGKLLQAALCPTIIMLLCFYIFR
ncbi:MAG: putative Na+/H+ antiporter [Pseudomonadota bacterium]|nr:putative Na+/H+ antiporter [Pseudomonadota bacterium]